MAFKKQEVAKILVSCHRRCCLCHKFCGVKMEIHHIHHRGRGGSDKITNSIPLCFECHAEVNHYNDAHPKGRKFTDQELIGHRNQWLAVCNEKPEMFINSPINREIGPLQGMLLELEFNIDALTEIEGSNAIENMGCILNVSQYQQAIKEGSLMLLSDDVKKSLNSAYIAIGRVNTKIDVLKNTRPEGNAYNGAQNDLLTVSRKSLDSVKEGFEALHVFLSSN